MTKSIFGISVLSNPLCERLVPIKVHKESRSNSTTYHKRIQKKWNKRYGMKKELYAIFVASPIFGNEAFIMHPKALALLKNVL